MSLTTAPSGLVRPGVQDALDLDGQLGLALTDQVRRELPVDPAASGEPRPGEQLAPVAVDHDDDRDVPLAAEDQPLLEQRLGDVVDRAVQVPVATGGDPGGRDAVVGHDDGLRRIDAGLDAELGLHEQMAVLAVDRHEPLRAGVAQQRADLTAPGVTRHVDRQLTDATRAAPQ